MFVQLNRARLEAVNTSGHRIFICRAVTLLFPVTESKHHNSLEEGHLDCKDAKLHQAVQKSRSVGHLCQPEQKESVTPVRPRAPRARAAAGGNPGSRAVHARELHCREQEDPRKTRGKLVFSVDTGRVKDGTERIQRPMAQKRSAMDVWCPEQWSYKSWCPSPPTQQTPSLVPHVPWSSHCSATLVASSGHGFWYLHHPGDFLF